MKIVVVLACFLLGLVSGQTDRGCPIDFIHHGESCYHIFATPTLSWMDAMSFCGMYSGGEGALAVVETADEQSFLEAELRKRFPASTGKDYWLGGYDLVNEGTWVWVKPNTYINDFTHWAPGEPNGNTNENCLALFDTLNYNWNDAPCTLPEGFICEVPFDGVGGAIIG